MVLLRRKRVVLRQRDGPMRQRVSGLDPPAELDHAQLGEAARRRQERCGVHAELLRDIGQRMLLSVRQRRQECLLAGRAPREALVAG